MQKKIKKNVFFRSTSQYHLTLRSVRKNISKNFPNQFIRGFPNLSQFSNFVWDNGDKNGDSDGDVTDENFSEKT